MVCEVTQVILLVWYDVYPGIVLVQLPSSEFQAHRFTSVDLNVEIVCLQIKPELGNKIKLELENKRLMERKRKKTL